MNKAIRELYIRLLKGGGPSSWYVFEYSKQCVLEKAYLPDGIMVSKIYYLIPTPNRPDIVNLRLFTPEKLVLRNH